MDQRPPQEPKNNKPNQSFGAAIAFNGLSWGCLLVVGGSIVDKKNRPHWGHYPIWRQSQLFLSQNTGTLESGCRVPLKATQQMPKEQKNICGLGEQSIRVAKPWLIALV